MARIYHWGRCSNCKYKIQPETSGDKSHLTCKTSADQSKKSSVIAGIYTWT